MKRGKGFRQHLDGKIEEVEIEEIEDKPDLWDVALFVGIIAIGVFCAAQVFGVFADLILLVGPK